MGRNKTRIIDFIFYFKECFFFLFFFFLNILEMGEDFKAIDRALRQARISAIKGLIELVAYCKEKGSHILLKLCSNESIVNLR